MPPEDRRRRRPVLSSRSVRRSSPLGPRRRRPVLIELVLVAVTVASSEKSGDRGDVLTVE